MAIGTYPFRCLGCNQRVWVNIWMVSQLAYAKCPKCLGLQLTNWPRSHYRANFWNNLLMTFGAHRYRCSACRYNFLSFRPRHEVAPSGELEEQQKSESETTVEQAGAVAESERQD